VFFRGFRGKNIYLYLLKDSLPQHPDPDAGIVTGCRQVTAIRGNGNIRTTQVMPLEATRGSDA
jgi:hypothetical protein